jgi:hypothetical protein
MGIDLTKLATSTETTEFTYLGQTGTVTFKPAEITTDNLTRFNINNDAEFLEWLATVVTDWDVTRAKRKVPTTVKGFRSVPVPMMRKVFQALVSASSEISPEAVGT